MCGQSFKMPEDGGGRIRCRHSGYFRSRFFVAREAVKAGGEVICLPRHELCTCFGRFWGFLCDRFALKVFLPVKKGRATRLAALSSESRTLVFYESPHRLVKTLTHSLETFGPEPLPHLCAVRFQGA